MKLYFVVNGRPDKFKVISEDLKTQMAGFDVPYDMYVTKGVGDGIRFVRIYCDLHPEEEVCFVACGGSGTLCEVVSGVVGFKFKTVAFLAYGATNDFIKYYPDHDFHSLKKLVSGAIVPVDVIKANNNYSLNMINIGFDSYVSNEANQLIEDGMEYTKAYSRAVIKGVLTKRWNNIQVIADGKRLNRRRILQCTVANAQWCGGTFHCAPLASADDGMMDVCLVRPCSLIAFAIIMSHYKKGDHLENRFCRKRMVYCRAKHVEVKSKDLLYLGLDGEVSADISYDIDILPHAIKFILPGKE